MDARFKGTAGGAKLKVMQIVRDLIGNPTAADNAFVMAAAGAALVAKITEQYKVKSEGGRDDAGITWKPTERGKPMMIDSGNLLRSFKYEPIRGGFRIVANLDYAKYALAKRPAWPEKLPDSWWQVILAAMVKAVEELIRRRIAA